MASRVVLHIGLQKSGSTYLQEVMRGCRDALARHGVLYPLVDSAGSSPSSHEYATYVVLGTEYPWVTEEAAQRDRQGWDHLYSSVRDWPGLVVVSAECLSVVRSQGVRRFVDALDAPQLDVVVTARELGRTLCSSWQQHVRNGRTVGFETYLQNLADQRACGRAQIEADRDLSFWRAYRLGALVRRWEDVVGPGKVRLVTNPENPPELLWWRFVEATGVPLIRDIPSAEVLQRRTHAGLTAAETAVLASVNTALLEAGWSRAAANDVRQRIIEDGCQPRADRGPRLGVPERWRDAVAGWSRDDVAELLDTGVVLIGEAHELRYDADSEDHVMPSKDDVSQVAAAAVLALATAPPLGPEQPAAAPSIRTDSRRVIRRRSALLAVLARSARRLCGRPRGGLQPGPAAPQPTISLPAPACGGDVTGEGVGSPAHRRSTSRLRPARWSKSCGTLEPDVDDATAARGAIAADTQQPSGAAGTTASANGVTIIELPQ